MWTFKDVNAILTDLKDTYTYSNDYIVMQDEPERKYPIAMHYQRLLDTIAEYMRATVILIPDSKAD